ncbi:MAG: hypothetical protein WCK17_04395 [Verrucomicrobiota bacterium]
MILLLFVSFKLIGSAFYYHLPNVVRLSIVALILGAGIAESILVKNLNGESASNE